MCLGTSSFIQALIYYFAQVISRCFLTKIWGYFLILLQNSSEKVRFSFILIDFVKILIEIVTSVSRFFINFVGE